MTSTLGHSLHPRRLIAAALCVLLATAAAYATTRSGLEMAGATARVVVDTPQGKIGDGRANSNDFDAMTDRSVLLSSIVTSEVGLGYIGRRANVDPAQIA